jgi:peptide deformylase
MDDLKDTMDENKLDAIAAFQIESPLSIVLIKQGDELLELINVSILKREGSVEPTETTAYFPGLSAKTKRYEKIKIMYQDREANQKFLEADGELAITIQRKIDYTLGSNFRLRMSKEEKELFDSKLEFGTDSITNNDCPTVFKRDRIIQLFKGFLLLGVLVLLGSLFTSEQTTETLNTIQNYTLSIMLALIVIYFFYAQYEGKQYKHCTSCQIGNIIGTSVVLFIKLFALSLISYFVL